MANKRASLGKGLDALLGDNRKDAAVGNTPISADSDRFRELEISCITASPDQPRTRFQEEDLQELADSIKQQGILQPIIVREGAKGDYQLVAGERRWRAAQKAGLTTIPAIISDVDDSKSHIIALLENIQRQDLNAIELSNALHKLNKEQNLAHKDIAEALSMSRPAVSNLLRLAELSPSIKNMLIDGRLDMGHARAILSVDETHQLGLAKHAAENNLTVRKIEGLAKTWPSGTVNSRQKEGDPNVLDFARLCTEALSLKVSIKHRTNGSGKLMIDYNSLEQLHHLTGKLAPELADHSMSTQEESNDNS